jgi:hypothetical protein
VAKPRKPLHAADFQSFLGRSESDFVGFEDGLILECEGVAADVKTSTSENGPQDFVLFPDKEGGCRGSMAHRGESSDSLGGIWRDQPYADQMTIFVGTNSILSPDKVLLFFHSHQHAEILSIILWPPWHKVCCAIEKFNPDTIAGTIKFPQHDCSSCTS